MKKLFQSIARYFYIMLFALGIFVLPKFTFASAFPNQTISGVFGSSTEPAAATQTGYWVYKNDYSGVINSIQMIVGKGNDIFSGVNFNECTTANFCNDANEFFGSDFSSVTTSTIIGQNDYYLVNYSGGDASATFPLTTGMYLGIGIHPTNASWLSNCPGSSCTQSAFTGGTNVSSTSMVIPFSCNLAGCTGGLVDPVIVINGGTPTASMSFIYPVNNTSSLDFRNWVINVATTPSSTFGTVTVNYGQTSSTLNLTDQAQFSEFVSSDPFVLPKSNLLNPIVNLFQTSTWYAQVCYSGVAFSSTCSSLITFTINPNAPLNNATSAVPAFQFSNNPDSGLPSSSTVSSTVIANPYSCFGGFLGISVGGCINYFFFQGGQILFQPTAGAQGYLQSSINNFELVPPFASVFSVMSNLQTTAGTVPSGQDLIDPYFNFGSAASSTPGLVILGSTTLSKATTSAGKNMLFTLEDNMFFLLDLGLIFYVPWHWWRKKHNAQQQK